MISQSRPSLHVALALALPCAVPAQGQESSGPGSDLGPEALASPAVRMVELDGDGLPDLLVQGRGGVLEIRPVAPDRGVSGPISINDGAIVEAAGQRSTVAGGRSNATSAQECSISGDGNVVTAGHAMRAGDARRRAGAVIGKAMSTLDAGTGLVLVLVDLQ